MIEIVNMKASKVLQIPVCVGVGLFLLYMSLSVGPELSSLQDLVRPTTAAASIDPEVQNFIDGLRNATKRVSGSAENETRRRPDSCQSRGELQSLYDRRQFVPSYGPSAGWKKVLEEYEALHRKCVQSVGDMNQYFLTGSTKTGCQFLVADALDFGLSNRLLTVASAFMYAILTHRVLLVPTSTRLPDLMCEPFVGSSWRVQSNGVFTPADRYPDLWTSTDTFLHGVDSGEVVNTYASRGEDGHWHPVDRFFCDTEQRWFSNVTWVYLTGCHYFLPNLFTVPSFRPILERLFPDHKMALTTVMRSLMLPSDPVWERVREAEEKHFSQLSHRVGIQVRFIAGKQQYVKYNDMVNSRVVNCLTENAILLPTSVVDSTIFVASLYDGLFKNLSQKMMDNSKVRVVQLTHGEEQKSGLGEDQGALVEILLLSFSDDLFVTPSSTFGGMAQVYGGLIPWFIDYDPASNHSCFHGQTVDICFSRSVNMFTCPRDATSFNGKRLIDVMPYFKECPAIETLHPPGFQIVNS